MMVQNCTFVFSKLELQWGKWFLLVAIRRKRKLRGNSGFYRVLEPPSRRIQPQFWISWL